MEHAVIEQDDLSITVYCEDGEFPVHIGAMAMLLLGPSVPITPFGRENNLRNDSQFSIKYATTSGAFFGLLF